MTDIDLVRTLIPDTDAIYGENEDEHLFSDTEIENFLTVARGSVYRAAGLAMIAVGNSEALILKVIRTQDLQTNGATLQAAWLKSGERLLDEADKIDAGEDHFFQIINYREGWPTRPPELTEWQL